MGGAPSAPRPSGSRNVRNYLAVGRRVDAGAAVDRVDARPTVERVVPVTTVDRVAALGFLSGRRPPRCR